MRCPHCSTDNPDQAKFCMGCGSPLMVRCAHCQAELPLGARFCLNCGQPVARAAEAPPAPDRAAPPQERKVITALFVDVVDSTALAEQLDAEDWTRIMNAAFERFSPAIARYGGTVGRLLGDSMLAFFGVPVAREDDPVRAVQAGLDLLALAHAYAETLATESGIAFHVRVGINTGTAVVGEVGSDLKMEYTAMGDAVNVASRLQAMARPMTALISEETHRFVGPLFDCVDLGPMAVRGKSAPIRVYEVRGKKGQPGRLRGVEGLHSPMVGRDAELAVLRAQVAALRAGEGRLALIMGEPGLGKSRLVAEWKASVLDEGGALQWAEGHCLSYGQGIAHHLIVDLLLSLLGVPATAEEGEVAAALRARVAALFGEGAGEVYPYLAELMTLRLEGEEQARVRALDPQALRGRYLAALRDLLRALAAKGPLVLVLDDIHWADPSSAELFGRLLHLVRELPLLFCMVTRAYQEGPGYKLMSAVQQSYPERLAVLALTPLSESDSRRLVANLLEIEALPESVRALILQKADGNPFFVEEVLRMLIERGVLANRGSHWAAVKPIEEMEIPDNVQALVQGRIDRLPEEVKHLLRVASVIGRQFSVRLLEEIVAPSSEKTAHD